ncbi:MAG: phenylacetate-CoA oxygenase subunit PaaC [Rhodoferax sp.]
MSAAAIEPYLLHLADTALILGQRNCEWCGHAPVIEEDLALANHALDLIGQARLIYAHVAAQRRDGKSSEDSLAYFRDVPEFRNYTILELPHSTALCATATSERDFGVTVSRNYLHAELMVLVWDALTRSQDAELAAIAAKSLKEARYHRRHSRDWVLRLGDGTDVSHQRIQAAFDHLMPYTQEIWTPSAFEQKALDAGVGADMATLQPVWQTAVRDTLEQATLRVSPSSGYVTRGKFGEHSEHLGYVLGEMQSLARAHPTATW